MSAGAPLTGTATPATAAMAGTGTAPRVRADGPPAAVRALIPLYVHPVDDPAAWSAVTRSGRQRHPTVVVNVHDGPGDGSDPCYTPVVAALRVAGVPLLGYVDLGYGDRPFRVVAEEIRMWQHRYLVNGVFFDRVPSGLGDLPGTARVVAAVPGRAVLNPGTRPHRGYARLDCTICTYEGTWGDYVTDDERPDWPRAAHLVYGVPPDRTGTAWRRLRRRVRCGLVSELGAPNPYGGLPAAWSTRPAGGGPR